MQVSLFNDQLLLTVPDTTEYITFPRTPETSQLCVDSNYDNTRILTDMQYKYTSVRFGRRYTCFNTRILHRGCYDASNEVLGLLEVLKNPKPEYW